MRKKLDLIRDSMIGAHYLLPHEQVFVYPFTDYLSLLFQKPLIFNFWDRSNREVPLFSTLRDTDFLANKQFRWCTDRMLAVTDRIGLTIHDFRKTSSTASIDKCVEHEANKRDLGKLFERLVNDAKGTSMSDVLQLLETSLLTRSSVSDSPARQLPPLSLSLDEVQQKLTPMVDAIESILADPLRSPRMGIQSPTGFRLPNMFSVFRTVYSSNQRRGVFNYQAGIRLFPQAANEIADWFRDNRMKLATDLHCIEDPIAALQAPTGIHSTIDCRLGFRIWNRRFRPRAQ